MVHLRDSVALSRSAIVLNPDARRGTDGFLTAYEVAASNLWGTDLVVLSACETGRGRPDRFRGIQGLRRAFFSAGAESLVTSLWSVDDRATEEFMSVFYERLRAGEDRSVALSEARRAVRTTQPDPYAWAPFVLLGKAGPVRLGATPVGSAAVAASPPGEDPEARLRRAIAQRRSRRTTSAMGTASWSVGSRETQALDADVKRSTANHQPLIVNLLGRRDTLSLVVPDYSGPGRYSGPALRVALGTFDDPLAADIARLHETTTPIDASSAALEVSVDDPDVGFEGRFSVRRKDGVEIDGRFKLESALPAVPAWMRRSMGYQPAPAGSAAPAKP